MQLNPVYRRQKKSKVIISMWSSKHLWVPLTNSIHRSQYILIDYELFIILEIVECAGGSWLTQMPKKKSSNIVIISCHEDKSEVKKAVKLGFNVQDKEFLLTGLLKQSLDFESHILSDLWWSDNYVHEKEQF